MSKKSTFVLSALALASAGALAQANNVNLYGIVDAAVRMETNNGPAGNPSVSKKTLVPGGMSQSRLGINVGEDLGGGYRALVNMEHRLASDTGNVAAGDFWRQAWVGLQTPGGRITLGRQYNILFDLTSSTFAAYRYSPYIENFKPEVGMMLGARMNNMVKYSIAEGGFTAQAQVSAGEGTGATDKTTGGSVRYQSGALQVGAAYLTAKDVAGNQGKATFFGGSYTAGPLYLSAMYATNTFDATFAGTAAVTGPLYPVGTALNAAGAAATKRNYYQVAATYQLTPQFNLGAQYFDLSQKSATGVASDPTGFSMVGQYALSKRTDAYVEWDRISFSGATTLSNGARSRTGYMAGLRHRF